MCVYIYIYIYILSCVSQLLYVYFEQSREMLCCARSKAARRGAPPAGCSADRAGGLPEQAFKGHITAVINYKGVCLI